MEPGKADGRQKTGIQVSRDDPSEGYEDSELQEVEVRGAMTSRSRAIMKDSMLQKVQYAAEGNDEDICGGKKQSAQGTWKWNRCFFRANIKCFCTRQLVI